MLNIKTLNILNALQNVPEKETALVEEDKTIYVYTDGAWQKFNPDDNKFKINLFELNQIAVAQLPSLTKKDIAAKQVIVKDYYEKNCAKVNYFMLLSNELRYYTIFSRVPNAKEKIEDVIIECLQNLGDIKSIEKNEDGVIECWVAPSADKAYPVYFFDYTEGVIECQ